MAKRDRMPRPVAVRELIRKVLGPGDLEALKERQQIRQVWDSVLPKALRAQTRLLEVRRRELWVEASAGAWAQELQFLKPRILEELEKVLGPGKIRDLRVRVGDNV